MDYDATPIHAYTAYSFAEWKHMQLFTMRWMRRFLIPMSVCMGMSLCMTLDAGFVRDAPGDVIRILGLFALFVLLTAHTCGLFFRPLYRRYNKFHAGGEDIWFAGSGFSTESRASGSTIRAQYAYHQMYRIVETRQYFYLYLTPRQLHLVNKAGLAEHVDEVRNLLMQAMPARKYKIYKRAR